MQKDLVFFKKEGEEGVALTSTSANHIANLAKEYIQGVETQLNNICFFNAEVALVGSTGTSIIQTGETSEVLNNLQSLLEGVAQAKSLIAWLREGIKAKESLVKGLQTISLEDWCKENGIAKPEAPCYGLVLTEIEYYASLPIKERNRYYQLETEAAVLGKYIHPDGHLSDARAAEAIKGGKESGSLTNVKLVENLVESYKGKTARTPIEVIVTSAIFLNARELTGVIEALKYTLRVKMVEELKEKADKGEATAEDAIAALMLAAIMKKESKED